jgi:folate-binding protein YgfZ
MPTILRPSRALFRFSGPDAQKLLFDVVTGRLVAEPGPPVWWALLSPQGKIQAEGLAIYREDGFWLDVDRSVADAFLKRMRMYKLRAAVEIEDHRDDYIVGWMESQPPKFRIFGQDPRAAGYGWHIVTARDQIRWRSDATPALARVEHGVPELGPDFGPDEVFPHDIGMDLLGGVDFKKGCYIGQEVVSRMQHRGTARRRPIIVTGVDAPMGTTVKVAGRDAGTIGTPVDGKAVAIVRLDRFDGGEVTVADKPVTVTLPSWATYRLGESAVAE